MSTTAEQLILRGLNLVVRASFSPNDPAGQAKHFAGLTQDIGPWFKDYADEIAKPAVDWSVDFKQAANREPQLGYATTRQLLDELRARTERHILHTHAHDLIGKLETEIIVNADGGLDYRTVDDQ